jgi:hypothetical protein
MISSWRVPRLVGSALMIDDEVAQLGHANLVAFSRESALWGEGGEFREEAGVLLFATGSWIPINCNGAFRLDPDVAAEEVVERADNFFDELGRGYCVKVRDTGDDDDLRAACQAAGLEKFRSGEPQMVLNAPLPDVSPAPGVELRIVTTEAQVVDFSRVNEDAYAIYGMPPDQVAALFSRPANMLACADAISVVAYRDGEPLSAAQVYLSHGIAGVYWVGTVSAARGKGLAESVTRVVGNMAFDRGARFSTLQASTMGEPVYRRMGYVELYRYEDYVRWSAPR